MSTGWGRVTSTTTSGVSLAVGKVVNRLADFPIADSASPYSVKKMMVQSSGSAHIKVAGRKQRGDPTEVGEVIAADDCRQHGSRVIAFLPIEWQCAVQKVVQTGHDV